MASTAQRSFAGGEFTPQLWARTDVQKYQSGTKVLRNFVVQREGGASYRPGLDFVGQVPNAGPVRLIKFVFNSTQAYVLEFGQYYVKAYANGADLGQIAVTP